MRFLENKWAGFLACGVAGGLAGFVFLEATPKLKSLGTRPKVRVDDAPVSKDRGFRASFASTIKKAGPSVVSIYTKKQIRRRPSAPFFNELLDEPFFRRFLPPQLDQNLLQRGLGSGVIVSEDGYILTNNHVIAGVDEIEVVLSGGNGGNESYLAEVVGTDPWTEIAVIKINADELPAITLGNSDNLEIGDVVLAIGNPFGVGKTVTMGIVSAVGRGIQDSSNGSFIENYIQTDAAINPGNSGGALVDADGRLIGINTAIASRSGGYDGVGFAVPVNIARNVMNDLTAHGKVRRGYLGVGIQSITPDLAKKFGLDEADGVLVVQIYPDTPAEEVSLQDGDVIVELDGKKVKNQREFRSNIATSPGKIIQLLIIRNGREKSVEITLGVVEGKAFATEAPWREPEEVASNNILAGIQIEDITPRQRQRFEIPSRISGALVVDVEPSSPGHRAGIRPGDVIQSIERKLVADARDAAERSRSLEGDKILLKVWRSKEGSRYLMVEAQ